MRHFAFFALCVGILALAVSTPIGGWTWIPILGLSFVAVFMLDGPKPPLRPFDREWD